MKSANPIIILVALCGPCNAAYAQSIDSSAPTIGSMFSRNRSVTVMDRVIPGYERTGVDVGPVTIRPKVYLGAAGSDNLYATETDRVSDLALSVGPSLTATLDEGYTRLSFVGEAQVNRYVQRDTENNTVASAQFTGRQDVGQGLSAGITFGYRRQAERRSDPGAVNASIKPILFQVAEAGGDIVLERGRFRVKGSSTYGDYSFTDGRLADGTVLSQAYRNRALTRLNLQGDYALTADLAVRLQANYAKSSFDTVPASVALPNFFALDRSSRRLELLGGVSFEFTDLVRGEIGVGYITQTFDSPIFQAFDGIGGRVQVEYLPTLLTTVTLRASRTIEEAGIPQSPSYLRSAVSVTVDHELYRNVIISGYVGYASNQFRQPDRSDRRPFFGAEGRYRLNRTVSLVARYDHLDVTSSPRDLGRSLTLNSASIGIDIGI